MPLQSTKVRKKNLPQILATSSPCSSTHWGWASSRSCWPRSGLPTAWRLCADRSVRRKRARRAGRIVSAGSPAPPRRRCRRRRGGGPWLSDSRGRWCSWAWLSRGYACPQRRTYSLHTLRNRKFNHWFYGWRQNNQPKAPSPLRKKIHTQTNIESRVFFKFF